MQRRRFFACNTQCFIKPRSHQTKSIKAHPQSGIHNTYVSVRSIADAGGGVSEDTGTFIIDLGPPADTSNFKPSILLRAPVPHWGSYADYLASVLSVDWTITNSGATNAYDVTMANTSNTNGITNSGFATASYGTINAGLSVMKTLKYTGMVSGGYTNVGSWHTGNTATAKDGVGTLYTYT